MKNIKAFLVVAGLSASVGLAGPAAAQMGGLYAGASIGQADFGSEEDTAWKILGGYQINRNFAAEIGYANLFDKSGVEVTALELVGVGSWPVANQFSVYGKLGFARGDVKTAVADGSSTDLTYAIGVQYDFNRAIGLRGEWQRYDFDENVDVLSVGVIFRF